MTGSPTLRVGMVLMSALMSAAFLYAIRWSDGKSDGVQYLVKAVGMLSLWLAVTGVTASAGLLSFETRPPTMLVMLVLGFALTVGTAFSKLGARLATTLPLSILVGFQAFRIPVELWLHRGYEEGLFPIQMTYSGINFDILSGITALVVAVMIWKRKATAALVQTWNIMGFALLTTVVIIAILSAPIPFRLFRDGPANVWVTRFPGVWLPAILVQAALLGHLLVFKKLASESKTSVT